MRKSRKITSVVVWFVIMCCVSNIGLFSRFFSSNTANQEAVTEDTYMETQAYHTTVKVDENNSYQVTEDIQVNFLTYRHGIYRYIPYKGVITETDAAGGLVNIPYYGEFQHEEASAPLDISSENGNKVFRLGDEDESVTGETEYKLSYEMTPITNKGYENVYFNVFPTGWRNQIPAGSTFSVVFPKKFDTEMLRLYYGSYGEQNDAADLAELSWDGNTLNGTLTQSLPVGNGLTVYVPMEGGYFQNVSTAKTMNLQLIILEGIILAVLGVLFLLFGRDKQIIPSIQFQPPQGLDSAAVGFIVDGDVSNEDMTSLFVYWANQGLLEIRETKSQKLVFTKLKDLPEDAPAYERILFEGVLGKGKDSIGREVHVSSLKYKLADTFAASKEMLKDAYGRKLYTAGSKAARVIAVILSVIPMAVFCVTVYQTTFANMLVLVFVVLYLVGILLFNATVDFWYSRDTRQRRIWGSASSALCIVPLAVLLIVYGLPMIKGTMLNLFPAMAGLVIVSVLAMILSGFMKKRTDQCVEWMGYLVGLRDFIETAELERMQVIAQESPQLFYHILPFAYVFGLSDILLNKMKELTLPAPDWYVGNTGRMTYFDYYLMHRMFHGSMHQVAATISTPRPPEPSKDGGSSFGGGGFSGGGFSGGGFGGGGGGSW